MFVYNTLIFEKTKNIKVIGLRAAGPRTRNAAVFSFEAIIRLLQVFQPSLFSTL